MSYIDVFINTLKAGDEVFLKDKYLRYTPYAAGGPIKLISITPTPAGRIFNITFMHIKPTYSDSEPREELKPATLGCVNLPKTMEYHYELRRRAEKKHLGQVKATPALPDI